MFVIGCGKANGFADHVNVNGSGIRNRSSFQHALRGESARQSKSCGSPSISATCPSYEVSFRTLGARADVCVNGFDLCEG